MKLGSYGKQFDIDFAMIAFDTILKGLLSLSTCSSMFICFLQATTVIG